MRLDDRAFILTVWLTTGIGAVVTSLVFDLTLRRLDHPPNQLGEALPIAVGLWLVVLAAGLLLALPDNAEPVPTALSVVAGYWIGSFILLFFLKQFLPGAWKGWTLFMDIVQLRALPDYHAFLLLVLVGGALVGSMAVMLGGALRGFLPSFRFAPDYPPRAFATAAALPALMVISAVLIYTVRQDSPGLVLEKVRWLTLPFPNMVAGTVVGLMIGLLGLSLSKLGTVTAVTLGLMTHTLFMILITPVLAMYDQQYAGLDLARVGLAFVFFWLLTPLVGAMAAFAMHNVRDALRLSLSPATD